MDGGMLALLMVAALLILLAMETPVAYALAIVGTLGLILLHSVDYAGNVLGSAPFTSTARFTYTVVPTFILIGIFAVHGRLAEQVYRISNYVFRKIPGGLGAATVMACAGFAAVTGSSVATAATMARLSIRHMLRFGYPPSFAAGIVAASGTLGVLIPPSIILVLYAVTTRESTGQMLAAGIIPGLLTAVVYTTYVVLRGRSLGLGQPGRKADVAWDTEAELATVVAEQEQAAAAKGKGGPSSEQPLADTPKTLPWRGAFRIAIIFVVVLGGIYSGIFTATESGAIGALVALAIMIIELRRESVRVIWQRFVEALKETAQTTSMVFAIVVGSAIFSAFLVTSGAPRQLAQSLGEIDAPPLVIIAIMLLLMIPLGMALESISILVITMPLLYPVAMELGFSGVWFGILVVKLIEIGLITPPVGIAVYVVAGASDDVTVEDTFKGVLPFVGLDLVVVSILFAFPEVVLWLPNLANR